MFLFQGIVIGYAGQQDRQGRPAVSPNFQEVITELERADRLQPNFQFLGSSNIGEDDCRHWRINPPVATNLTYTSQHEHVNLLYRKRFPKVTNDPLDTPVHPAVLFLMDGAGEWLAVIAVPAGVWSGARYRFLRNLDFFLRPSRDDLRRGLRPYSSNQEIIEIKLDNWRLSQLIN